MSDNQKPEKSEELQAAEYLLELARQKGVATASMSNGNMFAFSRTFLQAMLDAHPDQERFLMFVDTSIVKPQN